MYLLNFAWKAKAALGELIETEALGLLPLDRTDAARMRDLTEKCRELPVDLADPALGRTAEHEKTGSSRWTGGTFSSAITQA